MKAATVLLFAAALSAADAPPKPQPKQTSLEEANRLLEARNIRQQKVTELLQWNAQIDAMEGQIKEAHGIRASCRIDSSARNFVLVQTAGEREVTIPCPDAQPPVQQPPDKPKEEKKQ